MVNIAAFIIFVIVAERVNNPPDGSKNSSLALQSNNYTVHFVAIDVSYTYRILTLLDVYYQSRL